MAPVSATRILSAVMMVAGVTIGIGILGLPVQTGLSGFFPSLLIMIVVWLFMLTTGLIIARQVTRSPNPREDLGGLFSRTLGLPGRILTWAGYLVLLYGILVAHIAGGAEILASLGWESWPLQVWALLFFIVAAGITMAGARQIEKASSVLLLILLAAFIILIALTVSKIEPARYTYTDWHFSFSAVPIILSALAYQIIVPTLCRVLDNDYTAVRKALVFGTLIPVAVNTVWMLSVLGVLPLTGENSIMTAFKANEPAIIPLAGAFPGTPIRPVSIAFSLTALLLSFVLQSTSMISFFQDALAPRFPERSKLYSRLLTFIPGLALALIFPDIFLSLLDLVGGVSTVLLCGILPALVALRASWHKPGIGRWGLALLLVVFVLFLGLELAHEAGFLEIDPKVEYTPAGLKIAKS